MEKKLKMKIISILFAFASILIVNCFAVYDIETELINKGKKMFCELNCLIGKENSSNFNKLFNSIENINIFQFNNFIKPIYKFCNQLNSNLLDNIDTIKDVSGKNFESNFTLLENKLTKEIENIKQRIPIFNENNYLKIKFSILRKEITKNLEKFKLTKLIDLVGKKVIFKEAQNCKIDYSDSFKTTLKIKSKIMTIKFDIINEELVINKKTSQNEIYFLNIKSNLENFKLLLLNLKSSGKTAIEYYCNEKRNFFELSNLNEKEYCNN